MKRSKRERQTEAYYLKEAAKAIAKSIQAFFRSFNYGGLSRQDSDGQILLTLITAGPKERPLEIHISYGERKGGPFNKQGKQIKKGSMETYLEVMVIDPHFKEMISERSPPPHPHGDRPTRRKMVYDYKVNVNNSMWEYFGGGIAMDAGLMTLGYIVKSGSWALPSLMSAYQPFWK